VTLQQPLCSRLGQPPGQALAGRPLVTLEVAKHTGATDAVLVHQGRHRHAAAVLIPQRALLVGRQLALEAAGGGGVCRV